MQQPSRPVVAIAVCCFVIGRCLGYPKSSIQTAVGSVASPDELSH